MPRRWGMVAFLVLFGCFWAAGAAVAIALVLALAGHAPTAGPTVWPLVAVWLLLWLAFGGHMLYMLLWLASGRELLEARPGSLRLQRETWVYRRRTAYDPAKVRNLRLLPRRFAPYAWLFSWGWLGTPAGNVAFECGARTCRFGGGLDAAQAEEARAALAAWLAERQPGGQRAGIGFPRVKR